MKKIIKLLISYLPGSWQTTLSWKWAVAKYLKPRSSAEYMMAENFFLNFHVLSETEQKEKLHALTEGLDLESNELIESVLERQNYIFTHNILGPNKFFSDLEVEMQKKYFKEIGAVKRACLNKDFADFSPESFIFFSGLRSLPESIQRRLDKGVFIDGGAFNGDSSLSFYRRYRAKVYAFEPESNNFAKLVKNTKDNGNIVTVNKGLGDGSSKEVSLSENGSSSKIAGNRSEKVVSLIALDEYVAEQKIAKIDCIKLDLEGFEPVALRGMLQSIRKWQPILAISIYHSAQDFFSLKEMISNLGLNYSFRIVKANPFSLAQEVVLLAYKSENQNI